MELIKGTYIGMSDEAIDDGGESASHRQGVAGVSTDGGSDSGRYNHHACVVSLSNPLLSQNSLDIFIIKTQRERERAETDLEGVFGVEARDACFNGRSGFGETSVLDGRERREWTAEKDRHLRPSK